jgi:hypothetical protein
LKNKLAPKKDKEHTFGTTFTLNNGSDDDISVSIGSTPKATALVLE